MTKLTGLFLSACIWQALILAAPASTSPYMDSARVAFAIQVQHLIYNDHFETADSLCGVRIDDDPSDPIGHVFRAEARLARMGDAEENIYKDSFPQLLDSIKTLTSNAINGSDSTAIPWMYLFRGHSKSYRALYNSRFGSLLNAVKNGMKAKSDYEQGLKYDSTNYDLLFGLGSYHYWKSAKAGVLKWLFIFKNEKDKGIRELRQAADSSLLYRDASRGGLVWVYLNEKNQDSAIAIAESIRERFPEGKSFLWPMAKAYFEKRQYRNAISTYQSIRDIVVENPGNYFNIIECDYQIASCYEKMRLDDEAGTTARRIDKYLDKVPRETLKRQKSNINHLKKLARL